MLNNNIQSLLRQLYPMLNKLPSAEVESLAQASTLMSLPHGTVLFDENQSCQGFPLVLTGCIRVIKSSVNGRELQLYRVLPGESCILTSSCLLGHTHYEARGIVEEDLQMVLLPAEIFHILLAKYESFRSYVFQLFSERFTDLMALISAVAFQKLDQRLAALLIQKPAQIHTTHQALADELGSAREIVSRLLKSFADQGWVKLGREQIDILDGNALKRFAALNS